MLDRDQGYLIKRLKIMEKEFGEKLYTVKKSYRIFYDGLRTIKYMVRAKRNAELSTLLLERVMTAVTKVNGCPLCSYAHTRMALEVGISSQEIQSMFSGVFKDYNYPQKLDKK
ncbi:MAG: carboxymuconolactone decarboxylase family protein [Actinomycetia bacterium]|nr:carboxymuconolactone decarboxylase family protein [Actinomycetes bacterium]